MKKSSIKYFGVTAAALLAVSPIAAQTVSSSQGNTVAAASSTVTDQVTRAINNLPSTATISGSDSQSAISALSDILGQEQTGYNATFTNSQDAFLKFIKNPNWQLAGSEDSVKYVVTQANGWSADDTANTIKANTTNNATYPVNFTVKAIDKDNKDAVIASKNITVNFGGAAQTTGLKAKFADGSAKVGDNINNYKLGYVAVNGLTVTDANGNTVQATGTKAEIKDVDGSLHNDNSKFNSYGKVKQTLTFTLPKQDGQAPKFANDQGVTQEDPNKNEYTIDRTITIYNADVNYQPYFSVKDGGNTYSAANNSTISVPTSQNGGKGYVDGSTKTVSDLTANLKALLTFNVNDTASNTQELNQDSVVNAIKAAGGSIDTTDSNTIKNLSGIYYLTLTQNSPVNNKPATVTVPVNFSADNSTTDESSPVFTGVSSATVIQGQNFNAYDNVKAYDNGSKSGSDASATYKAPQIMSGYWTVQNSVNTNVPGEYNVVYSVVNSQGKTTSVTRKVTVLPVNGLGKDQVVNFVPGYGVMVWSATDNAVNATSDFVQHGTTVKTFDTKTVDGVSYTRINKANSNQWVQSKYFDANANNAPQTNNNTNTNTDSNQETPFESTLTINYVPGYRVFLRDGQANMQQQSVAHGESFKVWAKKTVGNHTYYRIGTDAQWIEDTYAQF
ncbi:immunoglobulin-like domain-containing protein [Holzapfeliella sp. JNUCC 80]